MRIAVPLLDEEIAPRFCSAKRVRLVDVEGGREVARSDLAWPRASIADRLMTLSQLGVTVLLCGGLNRRYRPLAERLGLRVEWRLVGPADAQVASFVAGRPLVRLEVRACPGQAHAHAHHHPGPPPGRERP
ncbi:MAG: hypothetical protein CSA66_07160 [Proteobacteria bacterium]|nr:MAG: hypothetical protein CSA66_07160 [Pseudomonadota bacterium]